MVAQWDLQADDQGTVHAVCYGTLEGDPAHTQTLANLKSCITAATSATSTSATTTPMRIANVSGLGQVLPGDRGLRRHHARRRQHGDLHAAAGLELLWRGRRVQSILLDSMDALTGTATLDGSASSTISAWEGITLNTSSTRVTSLEVDDEGLDGTIPVALGGLSAL